MTTPKSLNALWHGAYSKLVVLPGEDEQEFKTLHEDLRTELLPDGASEEATVFEMAVLQWRKLRLHRRVPPAPTQSSRGKGIGGCRRR